MTFSRHWAPIAMLISVLVYMIGPASAGAQVTTADVVGKVTDATGAVVPGAKVTVTNLGTNIARTVAANESGNYVVNLLPIGRYAVRVDVPGLKAFTVGELTLAAGDRSSVDA